MPAPLCAVSVDLDEIHHYHAVHGLDPRAAPPHLIYDVALGRIEGFARTRALPVTLFAVGEDLARPASAASLRALASVGHVVENHSLSHRYDLSRLDRAAIRAEIEGGIEAIERAVGARPSGFRAPGYTVSDAVLDVLEDLQVAWDSSVFPCPAYHAAKAAAIALIRLRGRASRSVLDSPRVAVAPRTPYRPGHPWDRPGGRALLELPIQVTPGLRLPVIGTSVGLAGERGARWLARACAGDALVNLELHGIDFLDATDGLQELARRQPELRVSLEARMRALAAFVTELRDAGRAFVTLDAAARALGAR